MSLRLKRLWLLPALLLAGQVWALGLGEIRLNSALNEPLRAEIELLAATPEELDNLRVQLASADTFQRYDLDRPLFLSDLQFRIVRTGTAQGNVVRITSPDPVTEPFLTFLVEASWTRGRLLREYTLLLDPPTFAPPPVTHSTQAVTAPARAPQTDSGRIERPAPQPAPAGETFPEPQPDVSAPSQTDEMEEPSYAESFEEPPLVPAEPGFDTTSRGEIVVQRGDTLWGITSRVRSDSRLTMNQTMLAIFQANPQAFGGNINVMSAGATLRIPSADEVFRISRGDALAEVLRQNAAWSGAPRGVDTQTQPSLTLLPPDEDIGAFDAGVEQETADDSAQALIDADEARIAEIEALLSDNQNSLIEISDNQLAALRAELAALRGEELPEPVDETADEAIVDESTEDTGEVADEEIFVEDETAAAGEEELMADGGLAEPTEDLVETQPEDTAAPVPTVVTSTPSQGTSLIDTILGYVTGIWGIIGGALLAAIALLVWFARRAGRGDDEDSTGMWESLEQDDVDEETMAATDRLRALASEDEDSAIVVVEQETRPRPAPESLADTAEQPSPVEDSGITEPIAEAREPADSPLEDSMIDTFEMPAADDFSDTQEAEPLPSMEPEEAFEPEASFEPEETIEPMESISDEASLSDAVDEPSVAEITPESLLEDTFHSDTAINLDQADPVAEADFHMAYGLYDQAADLINGALEVEPEREDLLSKLCEIYFVWGNRDAFIDAAGKLRGVVKGDANPEWDKIVIMGQQIAADHELFSGVSAAGATRAVDLSLEAGADEGGALDIDFESAGDETQSVDLALEDTQQHGALDMDFETSDTSATAEFVDLSGDADDDTAESRTVDSFLDDDTSEIPLGGSSDSPTIEEQFASLGETGELPGLSDSSADDDATELADVFAGDDTQAGRPHGGDATAEIELDDLGLDLEGIDETQIAGDEDDDIEVQPGDLDDTSENPALDDNLTMTGKNLALDADDLSATGEMPGLDVTDKNFALPDGKSIDDTDVEIDIGLLDATGQTQALSEDALPESLSDDDETVLASLGSDESTVLSPDIDLDFSKTQSLDETGELPMPDVDLDDLTGILDVAQDDDGPGVDRDAPTAEMPHVTHTDIDPDDINLDIGDDSPTLAASGEDLAGDSEERTMTEVGTKLDLARAYVDMGDPSGARSILEEVLNEGDEGQRQQAQQLLESMPS